ncbi:hypothetical protein ACHAWF_014448 [Thalassiosira exigua]
MRAFLLLSAASLATSFQFQVLRPAGTRPRTRTPASAVDRATRSRTRRADRIAVAAKGDGGGGDSMSDVDEYRNAATAFLSNFMQKESGPAADPLADVDFAAPKVRGLSLSDLAAVLDAELYEKEWFVSGRVNPVYFDDAFQFQDPDVKLTGVEEYARGVLKLFDQETSRAQIISSVVNGTAPNTITITWRLSGRVNIGPQGLPIKPYICYTDFTVDEGSGLITFQEDRFDVPGWDILLSALFPFLIGKVTKEPAPEVAPRVVKMPNLSGKKTAGLFGGLAKQLGL